MFGFDDFNLNQSDSKFLREKFSWDNRKFQCMSRNIWDSIWLKIHFFYCLIWMILNFWSFHSHHFQFKEFYSSDYYRHVWWRCHCRCCSSSHFSWLNPHIRALTFLVGSRNRNTLFGTQFNDKNEHLSFDDYSFQY